MADIFDFYVYDDRSIRFELAEPILLEDKDVTEFRFRIPKSLNGFDMSDWAWWFVYVNALGTKYSVPLTLTDDEDEPDNYSIATFTVNYGMSENSGKVSFAIEVIDANTGGDILHEWHTKTYTTNVEETLQGNQVEYAEDESDIISALIQQVQALVAQGGLDATGVTSGYVPTADGNDGWSWQAQQGGGGGGSVTVDTALSATSTNPVQNKVITTALNDKADSADLAAVATSGSYNDLSNKPNIPTVPVQSVNGKTGTVVLDAADVGAAQAMEEITVATDGAVTQTLEANKNYHFTGELTSLTVTAPASGIYRFDFSCGDTAVTLSVPDTWKLPNGFVIESKAHYSFLVMNGYVFMNKWADDGSKFLYVDSENGDFTINTSAFTLGTGAKIYGNIGTEVIAISVVNLHLKAQLANNASVRICTILADAKAKLGNTYVQTVIPIYGKGLITMVLFNTWENASEIVLTNSTGAVLAADTEITGTFFILRTL